MGKIKEILSESIIGNKGLYNDHARLEINENIHFHYRDGRYVFTKDDFITLHDIFNEAYKKYESIEMPESTKNMIGLSEKPLKDNGFHSNRLGCELNEDNTIHLHYRDLRLHFTIPDFRNFVETLFNAYLTLNVITSNNINLKDKNIRFHPVVYEHIKELKKYDNNEYPKEDADDVIKYMITIKMIESHPINSKNNTIERKNGFPDKYPQQIPKTLDRKYLFSLYESIKKYGYASGLFNGQYITVYKEKDNHLYVKDSHRAACLLHLGYTNIKAVITEPQSGWIS